MDYSMSRMKDCTIIRLAGKADGAAVMSAGTSVRELEITYPQTVILDIDGIEDQREMFYHVAVITTIKKEVEQCGGRLRIRTSRPMMSKYLLMTGLKKLFIFDETGIQAMEGL